VVDSGGIGASDGEEKVLDSVAQPAHVIAPSVNPSVLRPPIHAEERFGSGLLCLIVILHGRRFAWPEYRGFRITKAC